MEVFIMEYEEIYAKLQEIVANSEIFDESLLPVDVEKKLSEYGLNSINLIRLAVMVEEEFDIEIDDEYLIDLDEITLKLFADIVKGQE